MNLYKRAVEKFRKNDATICTVAFRFTTYQGEIELAKGDFEEAWNALQKHDPILVLANMYDFQKTSTMLSRCAYDGADLASYNISLTADADSEEANKYIDVTLTCACKTGSQEGYVDSNNKRTIVGDAEINCRYYRWFPDNSVEMVSPSSI